MERAAATAPSAAPAKGLANRPVDRSSLSCDGSLQTRAPAIAAGGRLLQTVPFSGSIRALDLRRRHRSAKLDTDRTFGCDQCRRNYSSRTFHALSISESCGQLLPIRA